MPAGIRIVRDRKIDVIVTTSPPNSTHLIGEAIDSRHPHALGGRFPLPRLSHPHRHYERAGVRAKRALERHMARSVVRRAAAVTTVTEAIADEARGTIPAPPRARP